LSCRVKKISSGWVKKYSDQSWVIIPNLLRVQSKLKSGRKSSISTLQAFFGCDLGLFDVFSQPGIKGIEPLTVQSLD